MDLVEHTHTEWIGLEHLPFDLYLRYRKSATSRDERIDLLDAQPGIGVSILIPRAALRELAAALTDLADTLGVGAA